VRRVDLLDEGAPIGGAPEDRRREEIPGAWRKGGNDSAVASTTSREKGLRDAAKVA